MSQIIAHNMILKYEKGIDDKGEPIFTTQKVNIALNSSQENILKCGNALGELIISTPVVEEELITSLN
ncbi:DUF1659 domain-containing protein [Clostridium tarantellae]|uniref:DUF1659 domain-containing protein n=1 Tax=Clostridium tarantellae TaxID=39493 RepID=A0A6I1MNB3_9CLOT|nr:DUF1659 domain-containing protein [Clostridium tarantellae]MPQ44986.1 DUF1659 domain-containing protein [Clostridium tarantellae]